MISPVAAQADDCYSLPDAPLGRGSASHDARVATFFTFSTSACRKEHGTVRVAGRDRKPSTKAKSAGPVYYSAQTASAPSAAPPASSLASKRPASTGLASTSPAKKRAFTSPYHEFCQELRPLLPLNLRNSEREKLLGVAWKALSGTQKQVQGNPDATSER